jgi:hypothetical protein
VSYEVRIVSGPAAGWTYITFIPPDEEIAVAPIASAPDKHGEWMRVIPAAPPWNGQQLYRRSPLPDPQIAVPFERLSVEGDIIAEYEHVPE